jgi:SnoaL-like polyketide cyclase
LDVLNAHEEDAALVRRVVEEIWNAGDIDLADQIFSSAYVNHGGLIPDLVTGPEGVRFSVALYRAAFPDLHVRVNSLSSIDGTVRLGWTAQTNFTDARSGAANGRRALSGTSRGRVVGGQIVESWTEWDSTAALGVLGILPSGDD